MKQRNNEGSTLITVLICLMLLSIVGILLLSLTLLNVRIKQKEKVEQSDFYQCEIALDEIKTGVEQAAIDSVQASYLDLLEVYTTEDYATNETKRNSYYYSQCIEHLKEHLGVAETPNLGNHLSSYLVTYQEPMLKLGQDAVFQAMNQKVYLKGIEVTYWKGERDSTLTTDLCIHFPPLDVNYTRKATNALEMPYRDYAIIAEGGLECRQGISSITGNVYAGVNGMTVSEMNTKLYLYSNQLITRGDIMVRNQARLQIGSLIEDARVWAKQIVTDSEAWDTFASTMIRMDGKSNRAISQNGSYVFPTNEVHCYIKNDLSLNAPYSDVSIHGTYTGYTTVDRDTPTEDGSSIGINGAASTLDFSALWKLVLGGYSYLSFPTDKIKENEDIVLGADGTEQPLILTGESLGIKSNQYMHLVPAELLITEHNPITYEEYSQLMLEGREAFDIGEVRLQYGFEEEDNSLQVQKIIYGNVGAMDRVVYYYISPKTAEAADHFWSSYLAIHSEDWQSIASAVFRLKSVKINSAAELIAPGSIKQYEMVHETVQQIPCDVTAMDETIRIPVEEQSYSLIELNQVYDSLIHCLKKSLDAGESYAEDDTLFSFYINRNRIHEEKEQQMIGGIYYAYNQYMLQDNSTLAAGDTVPLNSKYHMVIKEGDYAITTVDRGIVVATGDVMVSRDFTGLIIAGGKVTIQDSATVAYDGDMVKDIFLRGDAAVRNYFLRIPDTSIVNESGDRYEGTEKKMELMELVTYENWKKN